MRYCVPVITVLLFILSGCIGCTAVPPGIGETETPKPAATIYPAPAAIEKDGDISQAEETGPKKNTSGMKYQELVIVDAGYTIADYRELVGEEFRYVVYEIRKPVSKGANMEWVALYWYIIVLKNEAVTEVIRHETEEFFRPSLDGMVFEADVDYDSDNDILLCLGSSGNHMQMLFSCYLQRDGGLQECPSFSDIRNPVIDRSREAILGRYAFSPGGRVWAEYYFTDGEYAEQERLTEENATAVGMDEQGETIWCFGYTDEVFTDGEWQIREEFSSDEYIGDESLMYNERISDRSTYWDSSERWEDLAGYLVKAEIPEAQL